MPVPALLRQVPRRRLPAELRAELERATPDFAGVLPSLGYTALDVGAVLLLALPMAVAGMGLLGFGLLGPMHSGRAALASAASGLLLAGFFGSHLLGAVGHLAHVRRLVRGPVAPGLYLLDEHLVEVDRWGFTVVPRGAIEAVEVEPVLVARGVRRRAAVLRLRARSDRLVLSQEPGEGVGGLADELREWAHAG